MTRPQLDVIISTLFAVGSLFLLSEALKIKPPARLFPVAVLATVALLSAAGAVRAALRLRGPAAVEPAWPRGYRTRVAIFGGSLVLYALLLPLGYIPVTFVLLSALYLYLGWDTGLSGRAARLVMAAAITLAAYFGFRTYLNVNLPTSFFL